MSMPNHYVYSIATKILECLCSYLCLISQNMYDDRDTYFIAFIVLKLLFGFTLTLLLYFHVGFIVMLSTWL